VLIEDDEENPNQVKILSPAKPILNKNNGSNKKQENKSDKKKEIKSELKQEKQPKQDNHLNSGNGNQNNKETNKIKQNNNINANNSNQKKDNTNKTPNNINKKEEKKKEVSSPAKKPESKNNNILNNDKTLNKKRKRIPSESESDSSGSGEYSDSEGSESESGSEDSSSSEKSLKKIKPNIKTKSVKKKTKSTPTKSNKTLKTKESLVYQLIKRWWYSFDWPNKENYDDDLKNSKLRQVDFSEWKKEADENNEGFVKCIELAGFKGLFRDYKGNLYDFRPKDMYPSVNNFMNKDESFIYELLIKGIKNQMEDLEKGVKYSSKDEKILHELKAEYNNVLENFKKISNK